MSPLNIPLGMPKSGRNGGRKVAAAPARMATEGRRRSKE